MLELPIRHAPACKRFLVKAGLAGGKQWFWVSQRAYGQGSDWPAVDAPSFAAATWGLTGSCQAKRVVLRLGEEGK